MSDSDKPPSPAGGADRSAAASSPSGAVLAAQETEAPAERVRKHLRAHGGSRLAEFVVDGYPPYGSDVAAPSPSGGGPSASSSWLSCILGTRTFDESVLEDENTMLNLSDLGITDDSLLDEEEKEKRQISQVRYLLLKDSVSTTVQHGFRVSGLEGPTGCFREKHWPLMILKKSHATDAFFSVFLRPSLPKATTEGQRLAIVKSVVEKLTELYDAFNEAASALSTLEILSSSLIIELAVSPGSKEHCARAHWGLFPTQTVVIAHPEGGLTHKQMWRDGNSEEGLIFGMRTVRECWASVHGKLEQKYKAKTDAKTKKKAKAADAALLTTGLPAPAQSESQGSDSISIKSPGRSTSAKEGNAAEEGLAKGSPAAAGAANKKASSPMSSPGDADENSAQQEVDEFYGDEAAGDTIISGNNILEEKMRVYETDVYFTEATVAAVSPSGLQAGSPAGSEGAASGREMNIQNEQLYTDTHAAGAAALGEPGQLRLVSMANTGEVFAENPTTTASSGDEGGASAKQAASFPSSTVATAQLTAQNLLAKQTAPQQPSSTNLRSAFEDPLTKSIAELASEWSFTESNVAMWTRRPKDRESMRAFLLRSNLEQLMMSSASACANSVRGDPLEGFEQLLQPERERMEKIAEGESPDEDELRKEGGGVDGSGAAQKSAEDEGDNEKNKLDGAEEGAPGAETTNSKKPQPMRNWVKQLHKTAALLKETSMEEFRTKTASISVPGGARNGNGSAAALAALAATSAATTSTSTSTSTSNKEQLSGNILANAFSNRDKIMVNTTEFYAKAQSRRQAMLEGRRASVCGGPGAVILSRQSLGLTFGGRISGGAGVETLGAIAEVESPTRTDSPVKSNGSPLKLEAPSPPTIAKPEALHAALDLAVPSNVTAAVSPAEKGAAGEGDKPKPAQFLKVVPSFNEMSGGAVSADVAAPSAASGTDAEGTDVVAAAAAASSSTEAEAARISSSAQLPEATATAAAATSIKTTITTAGSEANKKRLPAMPLNTGVRLSLADFQLGGSLVKTTGVLTLRHQPATAAIPAAPRPVGGVKKPAVKTTAPTGKNLMSSTAALVSTTTSPTKRLVAEQKIKLNPLQPLAPVSLSAGVVKPISFRLPGQKRPSAELAAEKKKNHEDLVELLMRDSDSPEKIEKVDVEQAMGAEPLEAAATAAARLTTTSEPAACDAEEATGADDAVLEAAGAATDPVMGQMPSGKKIMKPSKAQPSPSGATTLIGKSPLLEKPPAQRAVPPIGVQLETLRGAPPPCERFIPSAADGGLGNHRTSEDNSVSVEDPSVPGTNYTNNSHSEDLKSAEAKEYSTPSASVVLSTARQEVDAGQVPKRSTANANLEKLMLHGKKSAGEEVAQELVQSWVASSSSSTSGAPSELSPTKLATSASSTSPSKHQLDILSATQAGCDSLLNQRRHSVSMVMATSAGLKKFHQGTKIKKAQLEAITERSKGPSSALVRRLQINAPAPVAIGNGGLNLTASCGNISGAAAAAAAARAKTGTSPLQVAQSPNTAAAFNPLSIQATGLRSPTYEAVSPVLKKPPPLSSPRLVQPGGAAVGAGPDGSFLSPKTASASATNLLQNKSSAGASSSSSSSSSGASESQAALLPATSPPVMRMRLPTAMASPGLLSASCKSPLVPIIAPTTGGETSWSPGLLSASCKSPLVPIIAPTTGKSPLLTASGAVYPQTSPLAGRSPSVLLARKSPSVLVEVKAPKVPGFQFGPSSRTSRDDKDGSRASSNK